MRADLDLRERYRSIGSFTGLVLAICGLVIVSPVISLLWWPKETSLAPGFLIPGLLLVIFGTTIWRRLRPLLGPVLTVRDGGVIVVLSWLAVTLVSAISLMLTIDLAFNQAVFEAVSAWTTTGLSVVDVEKTPQMVLLGRSTMQLTGGAGMAIILVTLAGGPMGPGLAVAEGRTDQLAPHVRRSASLVLRIYSSYAVAGILGLRLAGMSWFDAVNHAFAAVSTGGFSTRATSIGYWDSPAVEAVIIVLMLLGSTNFQLVYFVLRGKIRPALRNGEVRTACALLLVTFPAVLIFVAPSIDAGPGRQLRVAVFEVVSALTTTGFSTTTYGGWPALGIFVLILLMIVGGGTGSTAGAMKQHRAYVLARAFVWEVRRMGLPERSVIDTTVWQGGDGTPLKDRAVVQVTAFAVAYLVLLALGTAVLVACGFSLEQSLFEYASALGTVGLSLGVTSPTAPAPVLWAETIGMLFGRLEIFIVLIALRKLVVDAAGLRRHLGR